MEALGTIFDIFWVLTRKCINDKPVVIFAQQILSHCVYKTLCRTVHRCITGEYGRFMLINEFVTKFVIQP